MKRFLEKKEREKRKREEEKYLPYIYNKKQTNTSTHHTYIYTHTYTYIHTYIYTHIYISGDRFRGNKAYWCVFECFDYGFNDFRFVYVYLCLCMSVFMYICMEVYGTILIYITVSIISNFFFFSVMTGFFVCLYYYRFY